MQLRDKAPDLTGVDITQRGFLLEPEQNGERAGVIRERVPGEPALMLERR